MNNNQNRTNLFSRIQARSKQKAAAASARRLRLSPPGFDAEQEHDMNTLVMITALLISCLWLLCVLVSQSDAIRQAMKYPDLMKTLDYLTFTPADMLGWALCIWTLPMGLALWNGLVRYRYHFLGSKAIYTMRRLADPWELYRRCFLLPAAMILMSLLMVILITGAFCLCFRAAIPARFVPDRAYRDVLRQLWHWWHFH